MCRACGTPSATAEVQYCAACFGPVELRTDWAALAGTVDRAAIDAGRGMARWSPLLAVEPLGGDALGDAPLVRAEALGEQIGLGSLWLLDETRSPSGSFKDRVVATALGEARRRAMTVAACASTGNLARALAIAARRAGMAAVVLVPDDLEPVRIAGLVAERATVIAVRGGYDGANRLASEAAMARDDWAWVNVGLRPWYVEGARTSGWDVARGLGWRLPDHVVGPLASGSYLRLAHDALGALAATGLVDEHRVALHGAQPAGCAPVALAWVEGATAVRPVRPSTIAHSVAMGDPTDGDDLLAIARATGGSMVVVPEEEILAGVDLLAATEGIAVEPAGGVVVRALAQLAKSGVLRADEVVVACLTGAPSPDSGASAAAGPTATIDPTLEALEAVLTE